MIIQLLMVLALAAFAILLFSGYLKTAKSYSTLNKNRNINLKESPVKIFSDYFIDRKNLFLETFGCLPSIYSINHVDEAKAREWIMNQEFGDISQVYDRRYYNWHSQMSEAGTTLYVLEEGMIIEVSDEYVEILYKDQAEVKMMSIINALKVFKAPEREQIHEINIIIAGRNGLDLKALEIKSVDLNVEKYYNDDFAPIDSIIKERLSKANDKGIILLHGLPGTGKTTYLRHLVGSVTKKVLFVSPSVASDLMNPEFVDLLIDNPNSILVIEDAENIIMDRKISGSNSVSNLLNLSDGLMSDCLNVQIICTFNSPLALVDNALMRKGRLIAKYEFGKLTVAKAQSLSDELGFNNQIKQPMTLAEITHPNEMDHKPSGRVEVIGFRKPELVGN